MDDLNDDVNSESVCSNYEFHIKRLADIISIILELKMLEKLRKFSKLGDNILLKQTFEIVPRYELLRNAMVYI